MYQTICYNIQVRGHLDQRWVDWFDGFEISYSNGGTILTGTVPDQAALHGVLSKIGELGLVIIHVIRLTSGGGDNEVA